MQTMSTRAFTVRAPTGKVSRRSSVVVKAAAGNWLPGSDPPAHLARSNLPGNYGFDPLGLGANEERLAWFAEAERVHCRWAMLGAAGVLAQELVHPDQFWYTSSSTMELPFNIAGLVGFQLFVMHWVESKRGYDILKPGSQDEDPIFGYKLPAHERGYPGGVFMPFKFDNLEEMKLKELKNGRLAMLAFMGFVMAAQVTGLNPLAALGQHLSDPMNTTMFSKAIVVPGMAVVPECKIPDFVQVQGLTIPAGCFLHALWP